jgi:hypothetical protein
MDPRIEEYIRANRSRYTREAITKQLEEAGHDRAAIDATWNALDAKDPDEVAGEGFWGRFWLYLLGINLAVFLVVLLATGMIGTLGEGSFLLAIILAIALAIAGLIAWGIVAATGPTRLGRTTATVIGVVIPLLFALLIGGTCYALVGAIGPPPPPPQEGVMELEIEPPMSFSGSGPAICQPYSDGNGVSVYSQEIGSIDGHPVNVSVESFSAGVAEPALPEGAPTPAPAPPGSEGDQTVALYISLLPSQSDAALVEYSVFPETQIEVDASPDWLSGTVTFDGLRGIEMENPDPSAADQGSISGTMTWTCEGGTP